MFKNGENMKVLISPVNVQEAVVAWQCGADIIDIKNISKGFLGASFPWVMQEIIANIADLNMVCSATLGRLPYEPGTAAFAALGAVSSGVKYVKAELYGPKNVVEGLEVMRAVVRACKDYESDTTVVAAGYADYQCANSLSPEALIEIAMRSESDMVMLDLFIKDGKNLFDSLNEQQLERFVRAAHGDGLNVALAGSIRADQLGLLASIGVDMVGVRGAVCDAYDRSITIDPEKTRRFIDMAKQVPISLHI